MAKTPKRGRGKGGNQNGGDDQYTPKLNPPKARSSKKVNDFTVDQAFQRQRQMYPATVAQPSLSAGAAVEALRQQQGKYVPPAPRMGGGGFGMGGPSYNEPEVPEATERGPLIAFEVGVLARLALQDQQTGEERDWSGVELTDIDRVTNRMDLIVKERNAEIDARFVASVLQPEHINSLVSDAEVQFELANPEDSNQIRLFSFRKDGNALIERVGQTEFTHDFAKVSNYVLDAQNAAYVAKDEAIQTQIRERALQEQALSSIPAKPVEVQQDPQAAYAEARQNLAKWDGQDISRYNELAVSASIAGERAGLPSAVIDSHREVDTYQMSAEAKSALENAGMEMNEARHAAIYEKPTKIERMRDGTLEDSVTESNGFTYKLDKETNQLVRYDADGNERGRKSFEEVKQAEHEHRARQYDAQMAVAQDQGKQEAVHEDVATEKVEAADLQAQPEPTPEIVEQQQPEAQQTVQMTPSAIKHSEVAHSPELEPDLTEEKGVSPEQEVVVESQQEIAPAAGIQPEPPPALSHVPAENSVEPDQQAMSEAEVDKTSDQAPAVDHSVEMKPEQSTQNEVGPERSPVVEVQQDQAPEAAPQSSTDVQNDQVEQPEQAVTPKSSAPGEIAQKGFEQELSQQESKAKAEALAMYEQAYGKAPEKDVAQPEVQVDVDQEQSVDNSSPDAGEKETPTFETEEQAEAYASYEQAYSNDNAAAPSQPEVTVDVQEEEERRYGVDI
jgi:hypothetical protein